jgi:pimeloyl-ACP methyl ester carboxylesterase
VVESGAAGTERLLARLGVPATPESAALVGRHDAKLRRIVLPTLIIHGAFDDLVPVAQAERLRELLGPAVRRMLIIPGAGHNDLLWIGREAYFEAIRVHIESLSGARAGPDE